MFDQLKDAASFWRKEIALASVLFFAVSFGFGVGYLARAGSSHASIVIEKCGEI